MKTSAILDGIQDSTIGSLLEDLLSEKGYACTRLRLPEMNIRPCRSCGSCGEQTPGRCVQKDDMESVYQAFGPGDLIVYITDIVFGTYSSHLKKAVDRLMAAGLPLYKMEKGHMLHPMRYTGKSYFFIGLLRDGALDCEEDTFKLLAARNSLNFQYPYRIAVLRPGDDVAQVLSETMNGTESGVPY